MNLAHARRWVRGWCGRRMCSAGGPAACACTPCAHLRSALPSPRLNSCACPPPAALPTRSSDPALVEAERARFLRALQPLLAHPGPKLIVTDSQVERRLWKSLAVAVVAVGLWLVGRMWGDVGALWLPWKVSFSCWNPASSLPPPSTSCPGRGHPAPLDAGPSHWGGAGALHHLQVRRQARRGRRGSEVGQKAAQPVWRGMHGCEAGLSRQCQHALNGTRIQAPCRHGPTPPPRPPPRSIAMIHRQSRGQLPLFVQGLEAFKRLKVGRRGGSKGVCVAELSGVRADVAQPPRTITPLLPVPPFTLPPTRRATKYWWLRRATTTASPTSATTSAWCRWDERVAAAAPAMLTSSTCLEHSQSAAVPWLLSCICRPPLHSLAACLHPRPLPAPHPSPHAPDPRQGGGAGRARRDRGPRLRPRVPGAGRAR